MTLHPKYIVALLALTLGGCITEDSPAAEDPGADGAMAAADGGGGGGTGGGGAGGVGGVGGAGGVEADGGGSPADAGRDRDGAAPVDAGIPADLGIPADAETVPDAEGVDAAEPDRRFSFFVTSLEAMQRLSGSPDGFGGDLGGIPGADEICQTIAGEVGMGHKTWRAFLSAPDDGNGQVAHAIERIGEGPWYDANGRLVAENLAGLSGNRPDGDPATINDLPDEHGVPISALGDAHDVITGSDSTGHLSNEDPAYTCDSWTSVETRVAGGGRPRPGGGGIMCGHSFPRSARSGLSWVSDHPLRGCSAGVNLIQNGAGEGDCVGCSGGYGGLYCFALTP